MTKEQQEAIELTKQFTKMDFNTPNGWTGYYDTELKELSQAMKSVLNMLQEQQEENKKKDKIINLVAEWISERCFYKDDYSNSCEIIQDSCYKDENCKDCIKQYFENKAKE